MPELSDELITEHQTEELHCNSAYLSDDMNLGCDQNDDNNLPIAIQDDKSSSFPFGTLQSDLTALYDQTSVGGLTDAPTNTTDSIDNLLANLAEDNANSLPSVGGGDDSQQNAVEQSEVASENSSQPAIAEDIPNGNRSLDTKNDALDAEMVSEDELPEPKVSKVDDAEEVSDEELPGPKRAELPADTEVVSEDELPASSRGKRKAEGGYDPASPTDGGDAGEKKPRKDSDGKETFKVLLQKYNCYYIREVLSGLWTCASDILALIFTKKLIFHLQKRLPVKKTVTKILMKKRKCYLISINIGKRSTMIPQILLPGHICFNMLIRR